MKDYLIALFCLVMGSAVSAQTVCPTAQDLDDGIRVEYSDGMIELITRPLGVSVTGVLSQLHNGHRDSLVLEHGVYILQKSDATRDTSDPENLRNYDYGTEMLDAPEPYLKFDIAVRITPAEGADITPRDETHYWQGDKPTTFQIGACSYAGFKMTVIMTTSDGEVRRESYFYLSDLGIGLYIGEFEDAESFFAEPLSIVTAATID